MQKVYGTRKKSCKVHEDYVTQVVHETGLGFLASAVGAEMRVHLRTYDRRCDSCVPRRSVCRCATSPEDSARCIHHRRYTGSRKDRHNIHKSRKRRSRSRKQEEEKVEEYRKKLGGEGPRCRGGKRNMRKIRRKE